MDNFLIRAKFAGLWALGAITFYVYRTIAVSDAAYYNASLLKDDEFRNYLLIFALFFALSLILKDRWNQKTNKIAGIVVGIIQIIVFVDGITAYPSAIFNYLTIFSIIIMATIVWLAYRWPMNKQEKVS